MEKLRISENKRYFVRPDGSPFAWLADTAWTVPARLKWDDVIYYLKTRRAQGFTVLQMVVLDPEFNQGMQNPSGIPALTDGDLSKRNEAYFDYVDWVLDEAEKEGFYVLLLPVWGQLVTGDDWSGGTFPKTVNEENAFEYASWLGDREKHRSNILWCLGGDRMPIHKGTDYRGVWRQLAEGLAFGLTGEHLKYNASHDKWEKLLITYHACHEAETGECSTFSYWTPEDAWISFVMLQSGHGLLPKNYALVEKEYHRTPVYPVWDGEPAYEMMPTAWPITDDTPRHGSYMVRKRAYWSLFSGAFGFTYGHACVWNTISEKELGTINIQTWTKAIHSEGQKQMKVLRDFLETYAPETFEPCQDVLLDRNAQADVLDTHAAACADKKRGIILVYFAKGADDRIDVRALTEKQSPSGTPTVYASFLDPATGDLSSVESLPVKDNTVHVFYAAGRDDHPDRVLILAADPADIRMEKGQYGFALVKEDEKKVFAW